ncbi:hypothetical protein [Neisseria lactamica]|nr:hypothetical protein [Neisseria lactamica]
MPSASAQANTPTVTPSVPLTSAPSPASMEAFGLWAAKSPATAGAW